MVALRGFDLVLGGLPALCCFGLVLGGLPARRFFGLVLGFLRLRRAFGLELGGLPVIHGFGLALGGLPVLRVLGLVLGGLLVLRLGAPSKFMVAPFGDRVVAPNLFTFGAVQSFASVTWAVQNKLDAEVVHPDLRHELVKFQFGPALHAFPVLPHARTQFLSGAPYVHGLHAVLQDAVHLSILVVGHFGAFFCITKVWHYFL